MTKVAFADIIFSAVFCYSTLCPGFRGLKSIRRCKTMTNNYESMLVFSVANGEEAVNALVEKFKTLIEAHGSIEAIDVWGTRKLAYPINYETEGYYVLVNYSSDADFPAELDRVVNITEGVLRSLTVRK